MAAPPSALAPTAGEGVRTASRRHRGSTRRGCEAPALRRPVAPRPDGGAAICPGSYGPVTLGHLDIITRASEVFDRVVVGVVNQPVRKQKTLFSADERVGFIKEELGDLRNVQVMPFA